VCGCSPSGVYIDLSNRLGFSCTNNQVEYESLLHGLEFLSHPVFKAKTRCSSYVCPGSSCYIYGQNLSTEYQCLYYIVSYYKSRKD
jgi:hypothetical protein